MDWEDEYAEWVYEFRVEREVNRDRVVLVARRTRYVDAEWQTEYLGKSGWTHYAEGTTWDFDDMPSISGLQIHRERNGHMALVAQVTSALQAEAGTDGRVVHVG